MTRNELANVRNRMIDRIIGMVESIDFDPGKDKEQRRLFNSLCLTHVAVVHQLQMIDNANWLGGLEPALVDLARLLNAEILRDTKPSANLLKAYDLLGGILDTLLKK